MAKRASASVLDSEPAWTPDQGRLLEPWCRYIIDVFLVILNKKTTLNKLHSTSCILCCLLIEHFPSNECFNEIKGLVTLSIKCVILERSRQAE